MEIYEISGDFQHPHLDIDNLINIEELYHFRKIDCVYSKNGRPVFRAEDLENIAIEIMKELDHSEEMKSQSNLTKSKYPFMNMRYEFFLKKNPNYIKNPIFKSFVEEEQNRIIFIKKLFNYKNYPYILDQKFREHYFEIRFISYICTHLYYQSIHFDKKIRKQSTKEIAILDQPIDDNEELTMKDTIAAIQQTTQSEVKPKSLEEVLSNEKIIKVLSKLTSKQREVLFQIYVNGYKEKEVAQELGVSQQAVSKIKRSALNKLKKGLRGA